MTTTYNCTSDDQRAEGLQHAQRAISEKKCIVLPTDTVYGIAADAFSPLAVTMLLASKGRSRQMPPPVLIPRINALDGLATDVPADARALAQAFWPGGLTLILHAQPSLDWDLGDTKGTVALRMPDDEIALELLGLTGPLAVSSANRTGQEAAQTASEARMQLAESVEVYLEGGFRPVEGTAALPSTIVDATAAPFRVVRQGAISLESLRSIVPTILGFGETVPVETPAPADEVALEEEAGAETAEVTQAAVVEESTPEGESTPDDHVEPQAAREAKPE
ncbi:threonylcarbamoyl-AMP synthase [Arthrobacter sp. AK01]|uniref:L-threonylcarbamoyladenylate synthase n=1 Tax=Micrococcaceae TaxID=1268 RepID=UPI001E3C0CAE|nr:MULTISPECIES: L-threonylcarbamoyladenylate synthase [Micrococcaceae]MCD4853593.1 threonylcarbamoyl-AMP synthase [Arthrobacter sp. AK01]MCP1414630.1 tRNA threonylcarbamoyl adenosine modification protein (Sua5/YciO/YrdC/YwlC family) [Paenarthrobacter sp. A20]